MSNPWITHLNDFRNSHPKLTYKECMIEAKKTYKPVTKKIVGKGAMGIKLQDPNELQFKKIMLKNGNDNMKQTMLRLQNGDGIIDDTKDFFKKSKKVLDEGITRIKTAFEGRDKIPPQCRAVVDKYGSEVITGIGLGRTPIDALITGNAITLGYLDKKIKEVGHDKLYHLYCIVTLESGKKIIVEKNDSINISTSIPSKKKIDIDVSVSNKITLAQSLENTENRMGKDHFIKYTASDWNCQDFLKNYLEANGWMKSEYKDFILQNTKQLMNSLPKALSGIINTATNLGSAVDVLKNGAGKRKVRRIRKVVKCKC